tara:strand:+ start:99 stop:1160 length:1062 start_codon:yes stop_codon:yes gene_type:complete
MSLLLNGDCLELMKDLDDESVDLIFCDLPYGQTSCKWDCCIDLDKFWVEVMRIKKLNTPIFFTTTTKFGVSLINSAPKKCHFRYDIVWVKSAPAGFLSAKKMPMRKHEMIYVFYEKLPFYDLSSHQHKFLKPNTPMTEKPDMYGRLWDKDGKPYVKEKQHSQYSPPLPVSVVKEEEKQDNNKDFSVEVKNSTYGTLQIKQPITSGPRWDPPLPVSIVIEDVIEPNEDYDKREKKVRNTIKKEENYGKSYLDKKINFRKYDPNLGATGTEGNIYDPPLPTTMLEIKSTRGKHSTEKPVALMEWVLKYYSKEGDVVLDPTMGSGSTGIACKNMNRNFIGMEMDDEIYDVAVNRIN